MDKRWLKLRDAARYSSIGINRLVELAEAGAVKGFQDPDDKRRPWVFDRHSIDRYREGQAAEADVQQRALNILNS